MGQEPDRIHIGASVILISLPGLANTMGVTTGDVEKWVDALQVPKLRVPGNEKLYCSLYPLESALFALGMPESFKGDRKLVLGCQELAGVLYGTLTREVIRERVKQLAKAVGAKEVGRAKRRKPNSKD